MRMTSKMFAKNLLAALEASIKHKPNSINGMWETEIPLKLMPLWMLIRDYLMDDPTVLEFARERFDAKVKTAFDEPYQKGVHLA